jgi:LacI family transcriptional regulator
MLQTMLKRTTAHRATLRDIAREVDVSITTVINVLKGRTSEVSPAMADRINKTVQKMGYVKNLTAASLSTRRSHLIGVVISGAFHHMPAHRSMDINPFYGDFVFRLEHEARSRGFALSVYAGEEKNALPFLLQRNHDAVVVVGITSADLPERIAQHRLPQILFDSFVDRKDFTRVCGDEEAGGRLAAMHMIERGRRKLAFVGDVHAEWPTLIPTIRYNAARKVCSKAGVPLEVIQVSTSFQAGASAAERVIAGGHDGVITAADVIAVGLVQGLRHTGVDVPGKVAVLGYDNLLVSRMCLPTLSTIDQHLDDKIRAVLDLVQHPEQGKLIKIKPELVVREST